jgi:four helix bundle protein
MPIRSHRDLECWRLANRLRGEVIAICERQAVAGDGRFCNDFRAAAGSVCRNLAEGFRRYESIYVVQFFGYALGSLGEVQDCLDECRQRRLTTSDQEFDRLWDLAEHTRATALKFMRPIRSAWPAVAATEDAGQDLREGLRKHGARRHGARST